jgi:pterin-4a-carbinolamine dehydratase
MLENLIFISYRRADAAPHTLAIKMELEGRLRAVQVFVDTHHIQGGDRWSREIEVALRAAKVVMPVIGRDWAGLSAEGARRIDDPDDWVRKEIALGLELKSQALLPLLVDGAPPVTAADLPPDCKALAEIQALRIVVNDWEASVDKLVNTLGHRFGFDGKETKWRYPTPDPLVAKTIPIPWNELDGQVRTFLANWSIEFSDDEQRLHHKRIELTRSFEFRTFSAAISFVNLVAEHARRVQHHPRWMNLWRTVKIWLTTWDAGHRVTALDIEFARFLDREYEKASARR